MRLCGYSGEVLDHAHPVDPSRVAVVRAALPNPEVSTRLAGLFGLLADASRARVLFALGTSDELCVGDLALALDASDDSVSYALRILRTAGLVTPRKEGRLVFYRLADGFPRALLDRCLHELVEVAADGGRG